MPSAPQSEWKSPWAEFVEARNGNRPASRPSTDYDIDVFQLPDCDFRSPDYHELTDWYWRVSLKGIPINGGLTTGPSTGHNRAQQAIYVFEWSEFREKHYWDVETGSWCKRGELPALE
jgi:hypothetical protein